MQRIGGVVDIVDWRSGVMELCKESERKEFGQESSLPRKRITKERKPLTFWSVVVRRHNCNG
jgi:hypothetical protein